MKIIKGIKVEVQGRGTAVVEIDGRNPRIADEIYNHLPIEGLATTWLEEVYFIYPLQLENENPTGRAFDGDFSYWVPGPAFCFFLGSSQPYSPVNHIGKVIEGRDVLKSVVDGDMIRLERI